MTLEHLDTLIAFVVIISGVSLLVTTLTQMMSALLGLRGTNLRWGIQTLLAELDPNLAPHAAAISEKVLHHPLISDSTLSRFGGRFLNRTKLASAIRKEELIEILRLLSPAPPAGATEKTWMAALGKSLENLDRQGADEVLRAAPEVKKLFPDDPAKADRIVARMTAAAEHLSGAVERWFDSVMDRVSQRFTMHMRVWTILFSVVVAFALHLDAFKLLRQLSADAELRARLVASADALNKKADEILVTSTNAPAAVYVDAMKQLISTHPNELANLGRPSGFTDLSSGKKWLSDKLTTARVTNTEKWLQQYEALVPQAALRTAADHFRSILDDKLTVQLIPDPYPKSISSFWTPSWLHFWGILASAALLSLGAPFWFNMLKTLSNLRPTVAHKEQEESKQALKKSGGE